MWEKIGAIMTASFADEDGAVYQPQIWERPNRLTMFYSAGWHNGTTIRRADCFGDPRVPANWVKQSAAVLPGCDFSFLAIRDSRPHLLYNYANNIYAAPSFDGGGAFNFSGTSPIIIPDGAQVHQVAPIFLENAAGKHLLYTSGMSTGPWQQSLAHDWGCGFIRTRVPVSSLQIGSGAYGITGRALMIGGECHAWQHNALVGTIPTDIRHFKTADLTLETGWAVLNGGAVVIAHDAPQWDQAADPFPIEWGGMSLMFYSAVNNTSGTSEIHVAVHDGPLSTAP